jgi:hypothetical protein
VKVGREHDELLSSNRQEDVVKARDLVEAKPDEVSPMALLVLSIRLYDVGLRDDAVFWYEVAQARFHTMEGVLTFEDRETTKIRDGVAALTDLSGPTIGGYALCDPEKMKAAKTRALEWVESHPYELLFSSRLPAKGKDRVEWLKARVGAMRAKLMSDFEFIDMLLPQVQEQRKRQGAEAKYCW